MITIPRGAVIAGDPERIDLGAIRAERDRLGRRQARLKPTITRALDVPRTLWLGSRPFVVAELRLGDLAELQAWLEDQTEAPLDGEPPAWADPDADTRPARLARAWDLTTAWPVRLGSIEAARFQFSLPGRIFTLHLALRRYHPALDFDELEAIHGETTPAQWAKLQRTIWGISARAEITSELVPDTSPSVGTDWPDQIYRVLERFHLSFEQIRNLSLTQWKILTSGGKTPEANPEFLARTNAVRSILSP